ncbi:hypothetical protein AB0J21_07220 [Streptomyces sp. NPDC049954]|uniref:hypothetical protein n=1 Tax=Streptomyces sp. NPDC049954 TaxID=3155779 RepID=UPI00344AECE7
MIYRIPAAPAHFVDREKQTTQARLAVTQWAKPFAPLCLALTGPWGIGRTELANTLARTACASGRYPDGALRIDLDDLRREGSVASQDVLAHLLRSLGVSAGEWVELSLAGREGQYWQQTRDKRFVLVVDNARTAAEVRPLLPPTGGCLVIVTSRAPLYDFMDGTALTMPLPPLPDHEASRLLELLSADERLAHEPEELARLLTVCSGRPALVHDLAKRLRRHRNRPLSRLLPDFRAALKDGDLDVLTRLHDESYAELGPDAALLYRLLPLAPGPSVSAAACTALLGRGPWAGGEALDELAEKGLVTPLDEPQEPVAARLVTLTGTRVRLDEVLRAHAERWADREGAADDRDAARARLTRWLLRQAQHARLLFAGRTLTRAPATPALPGVPDLDFEKAAAAGTGEEVRTSVSDWFWAEAPVLYRTVETAYAHGLDAECWALCEPLWTFHFDRPSPVETLSAFATGAAAALRSGDVRALARLLSMAARIHWEQGEFAAADTELGRAEGAVGALEAAGPDAEGEDRKLLASVREARGMWHGALGRAAAAQGREEERARQWRSAFGRFEEARLLHATIPNDYGVHLQTYREGEALLHLGDHAGAAARLTRAHAWMREDNRLRLTGRTAFALAGAERGLGHRAEAERLYSEALANAGLRNAGREQEEALLALAALAEESGEPGRAASYRERARDLRRSNGGLLPEEDTAAG